MKRGVYRRRKYHNVPTEFRGELYDSKAEAHRAAVLEQLRKAGKIRWWRRGRKYMLIPGAKGLRAVTYTPDFEVGQYDDTKLSWVEDVKAVSRKTGRARVTQHFRIKQKLWAVCFPDVELRLVDKFGNRLR